jgi:hypothetical protein
MSQRKMNSSVRKNSQKTRKQKMRIIRLMAKRVVLVMIKKMEMKMTNLRRVRARMKTIIKASRLRRQSKIWLNVNAKKRN